MPGLARLWRHGKQMVSICNEEEITPKRTAGGKLRSYLAVAFSSLGAMTPPLNTSVGTSACCAGIIVLPFDLPEKSSGAGMRAALLEEESM